jgi:hypothetical protein
MRAASIAAVLALLVCASVCEASLTARRGGASKAQPTLKMNNHGTAYGLIAQLVASLHFKNYTWFASLLADDGYYKVSDISCGLLNKTQLVAAAMSESKYSASQAILGEWVESDEGITIVHAEVGAIFGPASPFANQTVYLPNVYYVGMATADGTQLQLFERWTDASYRQQNASMMLNTFNTVVAAEALADIKPWLNLITPEFMFMWHAPWGEVAPMSQNATTFLAGLATSYSRQSLNQIRVADVFPVCDRVYANVMSFKEMKDGTAYVAKLFVGLQLDSSFNIVTLAEWALGQL